MEDNTMKAVISRHFPSVAFAMEGLDDDNAFKPWKARACRGEPTRLAHAPQPCDDAFRAGDVPRTRPACQPARQSG